MSTFLTAFTGFTPTFRFFPNADITLHNADAGERGGGGKGVGYGWTGETEQTMAHRQKLLTLNLMRICMVTQQPNASTGHAWKLGPPGHADGSATIQISGRVKRRSIFNSRHQCGHIGRYQQSVPWWDNQMSKASGAWFSRNSYTLVHLQNLTVGNARGWGAGMPKRFAPARWIPARLDRSSPRAKTQASHDTARPTNIVAAVRMRWWSWNWSPAAHRHGVTKVQNVQTMMAGLSHLF